MHHLPSVEIEDGTTSRVHNFLVFSFTCGTILQLRFSTFSYPQTGKILQLNSGK